MAVENALPTQQCLMALYAYQADDYIISACRSGNVFTPPSGEISGMTAGAGVMAFIGQRDMHIAPHRVFPPALTPPTAANVVFPAHR